MQRQKKAKLLTSKDRRNTIKKSTWKIQMSFSRIFYLSTGRYGFAEILHIEIKDVKGFKNILVNKYPSNSFFFYQSSQYKN